MAAALTDDADDTDGLAGDPAPRVLALVRAQGRTFGIDSRHVVRAIAPPSDMAAMPRHSGAAVGLVSHGAQLVPVIDLQRWPADAPEGDGTPTAPGEEARIVILSHGAQVMGLLVDTLIGLRRCPAGAISRLFHDDPPDELFVEAALLGPGEPPLALLDPARLAMLTRTWCASTDAGPPAEVEAAEAIDTAAGARTFGTFRIGDALIGIPAGNVAELMRVPTLQPAPLPQPGTRGIFEWRGRTVPAIDLTVALRALAGGQPAHWLCVVQHGEQLVGLLIDEIVGMSSVAAKQAAGRDGPAQDRAPFVACVLPVPEGILQGIDPQALMAHLPESALSVGHGAQAETARAPRSSKPYMVFEADDVLACEVDRVQEVLPMPSAVQASLAAGLPARLAWRGHAVPVRTVLQRAGDAQAVLRARQLIVLMQDDRQVAIPIVAVKAMIPANTGSLCRISVGGRAMDVVSVLTAEHAASYVVVDLAAHLQGN